MIKYLHNLVTSHTFYSHEERISVGPTLDSLLTKIGRPLDPVLPWNDPAFSLQRRGCELRGCLECSTDGFLAQVAHDASEVDASCLAAVEGFGGVTEKEARKVRQIVC